VFGCGEAAIDGPLSFSPQAAEYAYSRYGDRLRHTDGLDRDVVDWLREAVARTRALVLGGVGIFGLGLGFAVPSNGGSGSSGAPPPGAGIGRVHVLPSTPETVRQGVFDATLPDLFEIESGDVVVYPDTWSHFLNRMQPGVSIDELAQLRREAPDRGPHSIIGPLGVRDAQPGDMLAIEFQRLIPARWGASFVNPADLGTGTLAEEFVDGQIRYLDFDLARMRAEFLPGISVPLRPFQGTVGVAPAEGDVVSSVPPGQHAGNIDLRDLTEGSTLYVPVWQPRGRLFTGDSHAAQGDGEVNNQAIESAMRELRVRVVVHKDAGWSWPLAETADEWFILGIHGDLNEAFRIATRNAIAFLHRRAGLATIDAYSLASIAISFRVTQFVNQTRGVHAAIPKALFSPERRRAISIV
jgi:acetamidase/formamidase